MHWDIGMSKPRAIVWIFLLGLMLFGVSFLSAPESFAISPAVIATQEQGVIFNLTASPDGGWQQGFDFRNTSTFVTDPSGDTYVLPTTAYPTKSNGTYAGELRLPHVVCGAIALYVYSDEPRRRSDYLDLRECP